MTPDELSTPLVGQGELIELGQGDLFTATPHSWRLADCEYCRRYGRACGRHTKQPS